MCVCVAGSTAQKVAVTSSPRLALAESSKVFEAEVMHACK